MKTIYINKCRVHSLKKKKKKTLQEIFLGSSLVKTPCFHCREYGFHPWSVPHSAKPDQKTNNSKIK